MSDYKYELMFIYIIVGILFFLFLVSSYKYIKTLKVELRIVKEGDNYYALSYIKNVDFPSIYNKPLVFKEEHINYEIISIEDYFYLDTEYKLLKLDIKIDEKYKKENNILLSHFNINKTDLITEIVKYIKKGIVDDKT